MEEVGFGRARKKFEKGRRNEEEEEEITIMSKNSKRAGGRRGRKKNTRAYLHRVATSSHLVKIILK
jgi:hypothetical protein